MQHRSCSACGTPRVSACMYVFTYIIYVGGLHISYIYIGAAARAGRRGCQQGHVRDCHALARIGGCGAPPAGASTVTTETAAIARAMRRLAKHPPLLLASQTHASKQDGVRDQVKMESPESPPRAFKVPTLPKPSHNPTQTLAKAFPDSATTPSKSI